MRIEARSVGIRRRIVGVGITNVGVGITDVGIGIADVGVLGNVFFVGRRIASGFDRTRVLICLCRKSDGVRG